jgi:hypothetical protein
MPIYICTHLLCTCTHIRKHQIRDAALVAAELSDNHSNTHIKCANDGVVAACVKCACVVLVCINVYIYIYIYEHVAFLRYHLRTAHHACESSMHACIQAFEPQWNMPGADTLT